MDNLQIEFHKKQVPIPVEYRPLYRVAQILLVLCYASRGKTASLLKIHLFLWALQSKNNQRELLSIANGNIKSIAWGLSPTVIRALNFALYEELITQTGSIFTISTKGIDFVNKIHIESAFIAEITFLKTIGTKVSESKIAQLSKKWNN